MGELEHLEQQVRLLSQANLTAFREWFLEYCERIWDQQIAADTDAGRLDTFMAEARAEYEKGMTREL